MTPEQTSQWLRFFQRRFTLLPDREELLTHWHALVRTRGIRGLKSYDAHLVAAMQSLGITRLLTFNASDFQGFAITLLVRYPLCDRRNRQSLRRRFIKYRERGRGKQRKGRLRAESDIDIAVVLDQVEDSFVEHERISDLRADLSLEYDTLVSFLFASEGDLQTGRFAVHRFIQEEGIAV